MSKSHVTPDLEDHDTVPPSAPVAEVFTLDELAERHGQKTKGIVPDSDPYKTDHMVAQTVHGWIPHAHDYGVVTLSDDDYLKALAAAKRGETHAAANKRPKK